MADNVDECPVCLTTYNDNLIRPRNLPCGHTFCSSCINGLKKQDAVMCPTCRTSHAVPEVGEFPISYALEGLLKRLRGVGLASLPLETGKQSPPVTELASKATKELSKKAQSLLQEQEAKILAAIRSCQEEQSQLADYLKTLGGWNGRQQQLKDKLQTLMDQINGALEVLRCEASRVEGRQEEMQRREQALHVALQAVQRTTTGQEAYEVIADSDHLMEEESHGTDESVGVFPDVHTVTTVYRVTKASHAALQAADTVVGTAAAATRDSRLPAALAGATSIKDKIQILLAPPVTTKVLTPCPVQEEKLPLCPLQAKDLLNLTHLARGLVKAGLVFAVQKVKGQSRYARISLENGRLHLYSLGASVPPRRAVTLQMKEVVPAAPPCNVFLDIGLSDFSARRVVVCLPRDTPKGRQFALLCSGQLGLCYKTSCLFDVECSGMEGERVWGGNLQMCDGAALLPRLDQGKYWESAKAGAVGWCWWDDTTRSTQFSITLRDWQVGSAWGGIFGEVVQGLDVVKEAAAQLYRSTVKVWQCGVLLNLPTPSKENAEQ